MDLAIFREVLGIDKTYQQFIEMFRNQNRVSGLELVRAKIPAHLVAEALECGDIVQDGVASYLRSESLFQRFQSEEAQALLSAETFVASSRFAHNLQLHLE